MCKYNMRNDIGCKFLYDKTLIKIYDIRTQRGYTLRKLEKKSGVSFSAINLIENGQRSPTLETLRLIAEALGTSVKDLFDEEE